MMRLFAKSRKDMSMIFSRHIVCLFSTSLIVISPSFGQTKLNNFVTEHLNIVSPSSKNYTFKFPKPGWVFIRAIDGESGAYVALDEAGNKVIEYDQKSLGTLETMRYISKGEHTVTVGGGEIGRLQVRRVPEIRYCRYQYDPWVYQEGSYDWQFLDNHILPHVNVIIGTSHEDQSNRAIPWRSKGGRWIVETMAPGLDRRGLSEEHRTITVDEVIKSLTNDADLDLPWVDGLLVDEYLESLSFLFVPTVEACRRIHVDPRFTDKRVDLYVSGDAENLGKFAADAVAAGSKIVLETYNPEQPTEAEAQAYLKRELADRVADFSAIRPGVAAHMIVALGLFSTPPETLDVHPSVNYRVYQDMEFHLLANDPTFEGLSGIMTYTSGYANEQTLRWVGRLYRHYCIEGHTQRLSNEPYLLDHLINPDFTDGTTGWEVQPVVSDSITTRTVESLGKWQGRFKADGVGDRCLVMTRHDARPNRIRQPIRNLQPGRVYTLVLFSSDLHQGRGIYGNPTLDDVTGVGITLDDVDLIEAGCYDHHYRSIHHKEPMFLNYHVRRFRAKRAEAMLTIADQHDDAEHSGNAGRETAINFIEVRPYLSYEPGR